MAKADSALVNTITPYIYGTTRLGDESLPWEERKTIAVKAMDSGVWFHTSHQYNTALKLLGETFGEHPEKVPPLIVKLGGDNIEMFREDIRKNLLPLGLEKIDVGQLCLGGALAEDFARGGKALDQLRAIQNEGLVGKFVMEVFPWTSHYAEEALRGGYTNGLVDAFIFYLNPLQRFASNSLWKLIREKHQRIIAMRTVAGGPVHRLRDIPGAAWKPYLQERAVEVAPIFERSGIKSWTSFCLRFAHSFPEVLSTVGSTARQENLEEFLAAKETITPLPEDIMKEIQAMQTRWSDELDMKAEPWSM